MITILILGAIQSIVAGSIAAALLLYLDHYTLKVQFLGPVQVENGNVATACAAVEGFAALGSVLQRIAERLEQ